MKKVPKNYMVKDYEVIDNLSNDNWKVASNLLVEDNTTFTTTGSKSKKLTTTGKAGTECRFDRLDTKLDFIGKSKQMMFKVWIEDPTKISSVLFYIGTKNWSSFFYQGHYTKNLSKGWNFLTLNEIEGNYRNDFNFSMEIEQIRLTIVPSTDEPAVVIFDSIHFFGEGIPKIILAFDDGWLSVYENAFPIMKKYGIPGTIYAIPEYSTPGNERFPWFCSVKEFKTLLDNDWCIGNHTYDHNYYYGDKNTPESYAAKVLSAQNWILNNGLGDGAYHVCYPNGEFNEAVFPLLEKNGSRTARSTKRGMQSHYVDEKYRIWTRWVGIADSVEKIKREIDIAMISGGTNFFMFHQIPLDDTSTANYDNPDIAWSKHKFEELIRYIVEVGADKHCVTHDVWFEGMKHARFRNKTGKREKNEFVNV